MVKTHGCKHHIMPTSIGGPSEQWNLYLWKKKLKHIAWHDLFKNFPPSVCIKIIEGWSDGNGGLKKEIMGRVFLRAWHRVFDSKTPEQAIKLVEERFLPAEKTFLKETYKNT